MKYLKIVAKHAPYEAYTKEQRTSEFTDIFGPDFSMLANRVTRFTERLPMPTRN